MVCYVEHDDGVGLRHDNALYVVFRFPGSSIESGSIAREIHLKWPRSVNHLGKAISLTRRRSAVKRANHYSIDKSFDVLSLAVREKSAK